MLATDEHRVNHRNQPENKKGTITDAHKNISRLLHTTPQINHPASTPLKKPPAALPHFLSGASASYLLSAFPTIYASG